MNDAERRAIDQSEIASAILKFLDDNQWHTLHDIWLYMKSLGYKEDEKLLVVNATSVLNIHNVIEMHSGDRHNQTECRIVRDES